MPPRNALAASILAATAASAFAAPDEIIVFSDDIQAPGTLGYAVHLNHVPSGSRAPAHDGARPSAGATRFMPEFTYGLGSGWETALHLPTSRSAGERFRSDGVKLRVKFVPPREGAADGFFWGGNLELARYSRRFSDVATNLETKLIGGWRSGAWLAIGNLNLERSLGAGSPRWGFVPSAKATYAVTDKLALGAERYHDLGPAGRIHSLEHVTFAVADLTWRSLAINFGVGRGKGDGADRWVVKTVVGLSF